MTRTRLLLRSLAHYWHTGLAVVFGLAVATAGVTGALLMGDSMRGSLREIALGRLGRIDCAITAPRYFRETLATDLMAQNGVSATVEYLSQALVCQGAARNADTGTIASKVAVLGIDPDFARMWPSLDFPRLGGRWCAVNDALAGDLGIRVGDAILVTIYRQGEVALDSLFARRERRDVTPTLRLEVSSILPRGGAGDFRLDTQAETPRNIFVCRTWLGEQLGLEGKVNAIVVATAHGRRAEAHANLVRALSAACKLEDHGLAVTLAPSGRHFSLTTPAMVLRRAQVDAARAAAADCGVGSALTSVYLATRIARVGNRSGRELAYAVVAGVEPLEPWPGGLGKRMPSSDGIWLNDWAAKELKCRVGDSLQVSYLIPTAEGTYPTAHTTLTLEAIVPLAGAANDPSLVPEFEGITNAERIRDWNPPFPIDLGRVTPRDEQYWDRYRATPKAFVSLNTVQAMWRSGRRGGESDWITSVRVGPARGTDLARIRGAFERALLKRLTPEKSEIRVLAIRDTALQASRGTSDFGQLFMGLSMFLVVSAVALAAMLLRLSVAQRASHVGIMLACGWKQKDVRSVFFAEGAALSGVGALAGIPLAVAYAQALISGLTTWWRGALGATPGLCLHVEVESLIIGGLSGAAAGLGAASLSVRQLSRSPVLDLLAGWQAMAMVPANWRARPAVAAVILALAASGALMGAALLANSVPISLAFFAVGALVLVAGLAGLALMLGHLRRTGGAVRSIGRLALRNAAAASGRSLLTAGLLASATFIIVATATNTRDLSALDVTKRNSGAGGFSLHAVSSVPLPFDPATPQGRANLGFSPEDEAELKGVEIISFLASQGEDISCLNLARPSAPRVLGVPDALLNRGGFCVVTQERMGAESPWELLTRLEPDGAVPAFGDAASVRWSLHSGLGQTYTIPVGKIRFRGLLPGSIFARELLVSEANFRRMFPAVTAPSYFLIATPPGQEEKVAQVLRRNLGDMGLEVRTTRSLLNDFLRVHNAYLSLFLTLGGLGLLLGTAGSSLTLVRSALERLKELALLLAVGHTKATLGRLLLAENGVLLLGGSIWGTLSALLAVAPHLASPEAQVNWAALAAVLGAVIAAGLATCLVAVRAVLRGELVRALRRE